MRMFVGFLPVTGMIVFMRSVVSIVLVSVLGTGLVAMTMCMDVLVVMAVFVAVLVGVGLSAVKMFMGVDMRMPMVVGMFVFVGSFHGVASSRGASNVLNCTQFHVSQLERIIQVIAIS